MLERRTNNGQSSAHVAAGHLNDWSAWPQASIFARC
jgi:hypothetical protein